MKHVLIALLALITSHTFANDEAGKQAFASLQAAAKPDKQAFVESYISHAEMQEMAENPDLSADGVKLLKSIKKAKWEERISEQYERLSSKLAGKRLKFDKGICKDEERDVKFVSCKVRFFIEEFAFNIEIDILPFKDKYKTGKIRRLNQEPTQAEIDAEKNAKKVLESYEPLLTKDKTLTQGYEEYIDLLKKDFGEDTLEIKVGQKASDEDISALAKRLSATVPDELASFYKSYGNGVEIEDDYSNKIGLHFFSTDKVMGVIDFIKKYGASDGRDSTNVDEFNDKLFVFAFNGEGQQIHIFMFDKAGHFYGFDYFDDGYDSPLDFIPKLTPVQDFDEKMNAFINQRKLEFIYNIELQQDVPRDFIVEFDDIF